MMLGASILKLDLIKNKWRVSEYVPFGPNRAAYEERRRTYLRNIERLGWTTHLSFLRRGAALSSSTTRFFPVLHRFQVDIWETVVDFNG